VDPALAASFRDWTRILLPRVTRCEHDPRDIYTLVPHEQLAVNPMDGLTCVDTIMDGVDHGSGQLPKVYKDSNHLNRICLLGPLPRLHHQIFRLQPILPRHNSLTKTRCYMIHAQKGDKQIRQMYR
jgi:hypothetical protein